MTGKLRKVPGQARARQVFTQACRAFSLWPNVPRALLNDLSRLAGELDKELRAEAAREPLQMVVIRCLSCEAAASAEDTYWQPGQPRG